MDKTVWKLSAAWLRVLIVGVLVSQANFAFASAGGQTGASGASGQSCGVCHTGGAGMAMVAFGGVPASVVAGSVNTFTFTISDGPALTAGLNISATGGMLAAADATTKIPIQSMELVHSSPAAFASGSKAYTYTFMWTAPATPGTVTLYGAGVSSNNDKASMMDSAATTFVPITVAVAAPPTNTPPTASFTAPTAGSVGIPVAFDGSGSTDPGGTITDWSWNFGDSGSLATGKTTTKTYMAAGSYTVQLTVKDDMNATGTTTRTIVVAAMPVNLPPTASFTGPATGTVGMPVTFDGSSSTDADGTIAEWSWNFGDGALTGIHATGPSATHSYAAAGTYPVTLTVRDNMGVTGSVTKNIVISAVVSHLPPVANAGGPYTGIVGAPVAFDGSKSTVSSGFNGFYTWDFGDNTPGITISIIKPMHVYTAPGTYTVTLKLIDDGTPPLSSIVTTTATITQATPPPTTPPSTGQQLYDTHCASCHGPKGGPAGTYGGVTGSSAGDIRDAIEEKSAMRSLSTLTANEIFAIAAYLKPAAKPTRGERLYNQNCASCHGAGGTGGSQPAVVGAREALIKAKIRQQPEMASLKPLLKKEDAIEAIAKFLGGRRDDIAALGDTSDTDDTFLNGDAPASEPVKTGALDWLSMIGVAAWGLRRRRKQ